jgi:hypothetical protein
MSSLYNRVPKLSICVGGRGCGCGWVGKSEGEQKLITHTHTHPPPKKMYRGVLLLFRIYFSGFIFFLIYIFQIFYFPDFVFSGFYFSGFYFSGFLFSGLLDIFVLIAIIKNSLWYFLIYLSVYDHVTCWRLSKFLFLSFDVVFSQFE